MTALPQRLLICGDVSIDWVLTVAAERSTDNLQIPYQWSTQASTLMTAVAGGAARLAEVLSVSAPDGVLVDGPQLSPNVLTNPAEQSVARTYSIWKEFPQSHRDPMPVWRMHQFLGIQPPTARLDSGAPTVLPGTVVVIDDANLGFRQHPDQWPTELGNAEHVIVKMTAPLLSGSFRTLLKTVGDRMTAYVSLGDLRRDDASIGQALSWEQLATDVRDEARIRFAKSRPMITVVSVAAAGAIVIPRDGPAMLVFDPVHQEGEWELKHPGAPIQIGTFVTAALALDRFNETPNPAQAVACGLNMMRSQHLSGYLVETIQDSTPMFAPNLDVAPLSGSVEPFSIATAREDGRWNLLESGDTEVLDRLAEKIVVDGERAACSGMPIERIGHWMSVDRTEIESVRSLRAIVGQYLQSHRKVRPLNVAVFGPPGSGKSFAVKQMSRQWSESGIALDVHEFNVAQFTDPSDMGTAFQRIRDSAVRQRLPLVFWDEFDTPFGGRELGWLARFLAPMQDGTFLENGVERPIGSAVFIFAGGTHARLDSFIQRAVAVPGAKATDFLSRLRGHVDVLGPNPRDGTDSAFVLRRALLIRALLSQRAPQLIQQGKLNIDRGVLNALIHSPQYLHGARSIEAIIEMSALTGRLRFERSLLPAKHQLAMHVDPDAFAALVQSGQTWSIERQPA